MSTFSFFNCIPNNKTIANKCNDLGLEFLCFKNSDYFINYFKHKNKCDINNDTFIDVSKDQCIELFNKAKDCLIEIEDYCFKHNIEFTSVINNKHFYGDKLNSNTISTTIDETIEAICDKYFHSTYKLNYWDIVSVYLKLRKVVYSFDWDNYKIIFKTFNYKDY